MISAPRPAPTAAHRSAIYQFLRHSLCVALLAAAGTVPFAGIATAQTTAATVNGQKNERPDALIKRITGDVMQRIKTDTELQSGEAGRTVKLVNEAILPYLNFQAMTRHAVGRNWSDATPKEQAALQEAFKKLLIHAYSGALSRASDHEIKVRRLRAAEGDTSVEVKTLITGSSQPLEVNYRMEKEATGWKIHDVSVANAWLIEAWRADFEKTASEGGIPELLRQLEERNRKNSEKQQ